MARIEWESHGAAGVASHIGFVRIGKSRVKIASIGWVGRRSSRPPYALRTEIPGWTNARHHETVKIAQESAERILTTFVDAMTEPKPSPTVDNIFTAARRAHERNYPEMDFVDFVDGFTEGVDWERVR